MKLFETEPVSKCCGAPVELRYPFARPVCSRCKADWRKK